MEKVLPTVGAVVSPLSAVAVLGPYLLLPSQEAAGLAQYYGFGLLGAWGVWGVAIGSLVAAVAFAGRRFGNSDPETVAGATLSVGILLPLLAGQWALAVDETVLQSITTAAWMTGHRWAVLATTVPVPTVAAAYARKLDLL